MKIFFNIGKSEEGNAEMRVYGDIGGFDWSSWQQINTANDLLNAFAELEKEHDEIHVRVNSNGGSISDGLPLINAMRRSKKTIHTHNDGSALSMGAMIVLAGHTVHAPASSLFMFHNAATCACGNAEDMSSAANVLDKYDDVLISIISDKTGKNAKEIRKDFFNFKDQYLTGQEAFEKGLVDVLEKGELVSNHQNSNMSVVNEDSIVDKIMQRLGLQAKAKSDVDYKAMYEAEVVAAATIKAERETLIGDLSKVKAELETEKVANAALQGAVSAAKEEADKYKALYHNTGGLPKPAEQGDGTAADSTEEKVLDAYQQEAFEKMNAAKVKMVSIAEHRQNQKRK
jgi:ATP-dependent Clp endopeptidase proteolytic subunit ClpP